MSNRTNKKVALSTLAFQCRTAAEAIPLNSEWRHYGGDVYRVVLVAIREATGELELVYRPSSPLSNNRPENNLVAVSDYKPDPLEGLNFVRPVSEWEEIVTVNMAQVLQEQELERLTPEQKLEIANQTESQVARFTRVYREQVWSDGR